MKNLFEENPYTDNTNTDPESLTETGIVFRVIFGYEPKVVDQQKTISYGQRKKKAKTNSPAAIKDLRNCLSKSKFKEILETKESRWRLLLKMYLKDYFVSDIYNRRVENKKILLNRKSKLLRVIENPKELDYDCQFDNNMMKNFCTGFANFYERNKEEMETRAGLDNVKDKILSSPFPTLQLGSKLCDNQNGNFQAVNSNCKESLTNLKQRKQKLTETERLQIKLKKSHNLAQKGGGLNMKDQDDLDLDEEDYEEEEEEEDGDDEEEGHEEDDYDMTHGDEEEQYAKDILEDIDNDSGEENDNQNFYFRENDILQSGNASKNNDDSKSNGSGKNCLIKSFANSANHQYLNKRGIPDFNALADENLGDLGNHFSYENKRNKDT